MTEKKSERLEVRLGFQEKSNFVEACETQGDTPSSAMRRFIAGYIKRADGDLMGEAQRRLVRRYGLAGGVVAALLLLVGAGLKMGSESTPSRYMSAADFAQTDTNNSGTLEASELGPRAQDILSVLDINGKLGIQLDEAVTQGRMTYVRTEVVELELFPNNVTFDFEVDQPPTKLVEFDLRKPDQATVFVLESTTGSIKPDRIVFWEEGSAKPKLVFGNADVGTSGATVMKSPADTDGR